MTRTSTQLDRSMGNESPAHQRPGITAPALSITESDADVPSLKLPRLPVLGWASFTGARSPSLPSVLDLPGATLTSSGRAAIALALRSLNLRNGDRVLVPTYHCPTMVAPIVAAGATPAFFPIDSAGAPRLEAIGDIRQVRAMIAAHYFGLPQPMSKIREFCDRHGIVLIEDCAHAMFGAVEGRPTGTWGDFAIASVTKFFPTSDGGCLVSRPPSDAGLKLRPRLIRDEIKIAANTIELGVDQGRFVGFNAILRIAFALADRLHGAGTRRAVETLNGGRPRPGTNARDWLEDFSEESIAWKHASKWTQWTIARVRRERIITNRRRNYFDLAAMLADLPGTRPLMPRLPDACAPYVFPLWVDEPERTYLRVRAAGVPVFRWDEIWPSTPTIPDDVGFKWATHVFQLGCHQDLRRDDIARMAETLRTIFA